MSTEILSKEYSSSVFAHTAATASKIFYVINSMVWLAMNDALINANNVFVYETNMLRVPKTAAQAWSAGDKIYYVAGTGAFSTTAGGNTLAGIVNEPAASADVEGIIHLAPAAFVNA